MIQAPASLSAAILNSAVALSPVMIAPAWPMRLPGGADPGTNYKGGNRFVELCLNVCGGLLFHGAANLPNHHHGIGAQICVE